MQRRDAVAPRGSWSVILSSVILGACYASGPPAIEEGESGTRLRRVLLRPESGDPAFLRWHDSELAVDCRFMTATDGRLRCLPGEPLVSDIFLDSTCTERVVVARSARAAPRFHWREVAPPVCGEYVEGAGVLSGQEEIVAAERLYVLRDGECEVVEARRDVRRLTVVDPARFVAGEVMRGEDTGGPLLLERLVAEDGATGITGLHDRARDAGCWPPPVTWLDRMPCIPAETAWGRAGGAACDQTWASVGEGCELPNLAYSVVQDACGQPLEVHVRTVGETVPESERVLGDACMSPLVGEVARTEPADDAVPWVVRTRRGAGRLQTMTWTDEAGRSLLSTAAYFDASLGVRCHPLGTSAGLRCVPVDALPALVGRRPLFADSTCTAPALPWRCGVPAFAARVGPSATCMDNLEITDVYRVGEPLDELYRRDERGECELLPGGAGYALEPVPLETLAALEQVIE